VSLTVASVLLAFVEDSLIVNDNKNPPATALDQWTTSFSFVVFA